MDQQGKVPEYPSSQALADLHTALLEWFQEQGRDLPWRQTRDPYAVLVAEVMLQQTQVERVLPKYVEFLERFPSFQTLADAPRSEVIRAWSPLGYNRRAVRLQEVAQQVVEVWGGTLPQDLGELRTLKGVGPYTAAAIACFAFEQDVVVLDTNVRRVLGRVFLGPEPAPQQDVEQVAQEALPTGQAWQWHQALMDVGATLCTVLRPRCMLCPLRPWCRAAPSLQEGARRMAEARTPYRTARQAPYKGSNRYYRGKVVEHLRGLEDGERVPLPELGHRLRPDFDLTQVAWLWKLLRELEADGLVRLEPPGGESPWDARVSLP